MKLLTIAFLFVGINSFAAEKPIEVCKSISKVTDFYACDIGAGVFFISKYNQSFLPKQKPSPTPTPAK